MVWKTAFYVSRGTVRGRIYLLFWEKSCFFSLSYIETFFAASCKSFLAVLWKCILRVLWKILRKNCFFHGKNMFFYNFWTLCHFSAIIPTFWGNRQNCTSIVEMHFEEFFLKKRFFVTLGQGAKSFGLLSKNFRQSFQTSFYVSAGNFWGIIYFSGKNRFFSIIFEYWVVLIWRTRQNCMLLVQIRFKIK